MSTRYGTDPDPKSPEEVEREVQKSRAEVEETLEAIQERLSPGRCSNKRWTTCEAAAATISCASRRHGAGQSGPGGAGGTGLSG